MIPSLTDWSAQRRVRLFADNCTAHICKDDARNALRSAVHRIALQRNSTGMPLRLDHRFRLRIEEQDLEENRLEYILRRFNGLNYAEGLQFQKTLERRLVASYQSAGQHFQWKRPAARAPVCIRLIDTVIGFGLFAERDLAEGELIGEYAGIVSISDTILDRTYCYEYPVLHYCGEETVLVLDAGSVGNETRFINHATTEVVTHDFEFFNGHWRVLFRANGHIEKGEQLFIDYGSGYWEGSPVPPATLSPVPPLHSASSPVHIAPMTDAEVVHPYAM